MATVAQIGVDLALNSENFTRGIKRVGTQTRGLKKTMESMAASVRGAVLGFATFEGARRAVMYLGRTMIEAEQSNAKLGAVLKATGHTAGLTAAQIDEMAQSAERLTLVDDKEFKNASAILATFRTVAGSTFRETMGLALDLSAVFGGDLQSSVTMLGKALEDPITGLTALRRVGVSFNDQQRKTITQLVETMSPAARGRMGIEVAPPKQDPNQFAKFSRYFGPAIKDRLRSEQSRRERLTAP